MSVFKTTLPSGNVRWRARVLVARREVAAASFATRREALAWHDDQAAKIRTGEWVAPNRGTIKLGDMATEWLASRTGKAQRTQDTDLYMLEAHILPALGRRPIASITEADVSNLLGELATRDVARSTQARTLAVLRGVLGHAVADRRLRTNVAAAVNAPKGGKRRPGKHLSLEQIEQLVAAVPAYCRPVIWVLALCGIRFSEMAAGVPAAVAPAMVSP